MLTSKNIAAKKRQYLGVILLILGVALILIEVSSTRMNDEPILFYTGGYGESIGQYPDTDARVSYSVDFDNPTKRVFDIYTVEPVLTDNAKNILIDRINAVEGAKKLKPGKKVTFTGEFHVDTSDLTEAEIKSLMPLIRGFRIIFNRHEEIIVPISINSFKEL